MIDLHTHTTASDGTLTPEELVSQAVELGLEALAVTDHDTLAGADEAERYAAAAGLPFIVGTELSTKVDPETAGVVSHAMKGRRMPSVHLLAYFFGGEPPAPFRAWLTCHQESRRKRNLALVEKLRSLGVEITLAEVESLGRSLTGRPHFAAVLLRKGYVNTVQEAFDVYLADHAKAAVERDEPLLTDAIERVVAAGGTPVLAHPVRLPFGADHDALVAFIKRLREFGLGTIEVFHGEHSDADTSLYMQIARELRLEISGGSDFHGSTKPTISLGTGKNGALAVPYTVFARLREAARSAAPQELTRRACQ